VRAKNRCCEEFALVGVALEAMALSDRSGRGRYLTLSVWAGGLAVAAGATVWSLTHGPVKHATFEVFLSMAAVLFIDDMLPDHGNGDRVRRWPLLGLTATVILFSRDPLIAVLAVVAAAPLAGLVKGQSVLAQLTKTAWWVVACGMGLLVFGAVANAGHGGFALGSGVLIVVYAVGENSTMFALRPTSLGSGTGLIHRLDEIFAPFVFGGMGAIYALSWRSSQFGSLNLDGGQLAIVASVAIVIGHLLGGTIANVWRGIDRISSRITFFPLLVGVGVVVLPRGVALAMVTLAVAIVLVVSVRARTLGGAVACVGGLANLVVVQLNGGMPTEASAFFRLVGPAGYARYASGTDLETLNTKLPVLDDRILLPHPLPFAEVLSVGDLVLAAGLMVLIVERMIARPRVAGENVIDDRLSVA
jgi:hypothetical protein